MLLTFQELLQKSPEKRPLIGQKALSLLQLQQWGMQVPDGACLSVAAFQLFSQFNQLDSDIQAVFQSPTPPAIDTLQALQVRIRNGIMPPKLQIPILDWLEQQTNSHWAVRSSGILEDLAGASFAGLYTTQLNIQGETHLFEAIKDCWASLFHERLLKYVYDKKLPIEKLGLALILQAMVPAQKSGVLFTVNPIQGRDKEMWIEATWGLGEALVSGLVTPDQYGYDWFNEQETHRQINDKAIAIWPLAEAPFTHQQALTVEQRHAEVLSLAEIRELVNLSLTIQEQAGFPVDIEWAKDEQQFYILQSRPITSLHYQGIGGEWTTADFKDGGVSSSVCSPFMWSLYDHIWEQTMPAYLAKTKLLAPELPERWGDMFFGRPYWNVGAVKAGLKRLPGFVERQFDESLGIEVCYQGQGYMTPFGLGTLWHGLQVLSALKQSFSEQLQGCPSFAQQQRERLAALEQVEPDTMTDQAFLGFYGTLLRQHYTACESGYFNLIFDNSNATTLFQDSFKPYKDKVNYLNLISGLTDLSHLKQNHALWVLSRQIRTNAEALVYWQTHSSAEIRAHWLAGHRGCLLDAFGVYLNEFKHHSTRELDITVPRYGEEPLFPIESLQNTIALDDTHDPQAMNQRQHAAFLAEQATFLALVPWFSRRKMAEKLTQLRQFLWWREELRDLSTQMYAQVRRFTLHLAKRLKMPLMVPVWDEPADIFFLSMTELLQLVDLLMGQGTVLSREWSDKFSHSLQRNKRYYQSFRHFENPNELGSRYTGGASLADDGAANAWRGVACSPGVVTGTARVIRDIFDADRLQSGDILITRFTDPGWTPKFSLLAGVATETGGLLSHAAVISREYGIPAVLAIPHLTEYITDGQKITLDGFQGVVRVAS